MLDPDRVLLKEIEDFLRLTGMSASKFGKEAVRDQAFVFDLRESRSPSGRTAKRVREFIAGERRRLTKAGRAAEQSREPVAN